MGKKRRSGVIVGIPEWDNAISYVAYIKRFPEIKLVVNIRAVNNFI